MPRQNDVLLFSSRLTHIVEPNRTDKPRHAIAFNAFVKGTFGGRTTELILDAVEIEEQFAKPPPESEIEMTQFTYDVKALFAEPYFRATIAGAIGPEQIAFIKNQNMIPSMGNLVSENLYLLDEPQLKSIKDAVQEVLDLYTREVMCIPQKLYVTQSWAMTNNPNTGGTEQSYSNSVLSGSLYYCELPSPPAKMILVRNDTYQQIDLAPDPGRRNLYNTPNNRITPKQNEVYLFSSRLTQMVEPNVSSQPRRAIAFNTFVKGKLGDYRGVSELVI